MEKNRMKDPKESVIELLMREKPELIKKAKKINPEFTYAEAEKFVDDYIELQKDPTSRFIAHPLDWDI